MKDEPLSMMRIVVVGTTGSGKTRLASRLSEKLHCPHIELDSLFWLPNWKPTSDEDFRDKVISATAGDLWIVDGNYVSKVRDILWSRADTIVWLDYSLSSVMWRLATRTLRRVVTQDRLWNGNRESMRMQLTTRESLFLWALRTHPVQRKLYPHLFAECLRHDQTVVHLSSPRETERWFAGVTSKPQGP